MYSNRMQNGQVKSPEHRKQRFSLRKFSFGAASILVGSLLFFGQSVSADEKGAASEVTMSQKLSADDETPAQGETVSEELVATVDAVAETATDLAKAEEVASVETVVEANSEVANLEAPAEAVATPKYVTKEYKATNTLPTNLTNNALSRPENEGKTFAEGTSFRSDASNPNEDTIITPPKLSERLLKFQDPTPGRFTVGMAESYITGNILTISQGANETLYLSEFDKTGKHLRTIQPTATPQDINYEKFLLNNPFGEPYARVYLLSNGQLRIDAYFDHRKSDKTLPKGNPNIYTVLVNNGVEYPAANLDNINYSGRRINIQISEPQSPDFSTLKSKKHNTHHLSLLESKRVAPSITKDGKIGDYYKTTEKTGQQTVVTTNATKTYNLDDYDVIVPPNAKGLIWPNVLTHVGQVQSFEQQIRLDGQDKTVTARMELIDKAGKIKVTLTDPDGVPLKVLKLTDKLVESDNPRRGSYPSKVFTVTNETEGYYYTLDATHDINGRPLKKEDYMIYFEQRGSEFSQGLRNSNKILSTESVSPIYYPSIFVKESGDVYYYYSQEKAQIKFWDVTSGTDVPLTEGEGQAPIEGLLGKGLSAITAAKVKEKTATTDNPEGKDIAKIVKWYLDNGYELANDTNGTEGAGQPRQFHGFDYNPATQTGEFRNTPTFAATTATADTIDYINRDNRKSNEAKRQNDNITTINIRFRKKPVAQNGSVAVNYVEKATGAVIKDRNQFVTDQASGTPYNATTDELKPAEIRTGTVGNQKVYKYVSTKATGAKSDPATGQVEGNVTKEVTHEYVEAKGSVNVNYVIQGTTTVIKDKQSVLANASNDTPYKTDTNQFRPATIVGKDDGKLYELVAVRTTGSNDAPKVGKVVADRTLEVTYEYRLAKGNVNVNYVVEGTNTVIKTKQKVADKQPDGDAYDATTENFKPSTITADDQKVYDFSKTRANSTDAPATGNVEGNKTKEVTHEYVEVKGDVKVNYVIQGTEETLQPQQTAVSQASNNTDYDTNTTALKPQTLSKNGKNYTLVGVRTTGQNDSPETGKVVARETKYVTYEYREVVTPPVVQNGSVNVNYVVKGTNKSIKTPEAVVTDQPAGTEYDATTGDKQPAKIEFVEDGKQKVYKFSNTRRNTGDAPGVGQVDANVTKEVTHEYVEALGDVKVNYVIVDTNTELQPQATVIGPSSNDTAYNAETPALKPLTISKNGKTYAFVKVREGENDAPSTGKVEAEKTKQVTFEYREVPPVKQGSVIVKYQNEDGTEIKTPVTVKNNVPVDEAYETDTRDLKPSSIKATDNKVYTFKKHKADSDAPSGTVTEGTKEVVYVYAEVKGNVTVRYYNEAGEEIADSVEDTPFSSNGTEYSTLDNKPLTITGRDGKLYELTANPVRTDSDPESGNINVEKKQQLVVNYVYKLVEGSVEVNYVDEDGNPIHKTVVDTPSAPVGTDYNTDEDHKKQYITTPENKVYEFVKVKEDSAKPIGKVVKGKTTVTYVYREVDQVANITYHIRDPKTGTLTPIPYAPAEEANGKTGTPITFNNYTPNLERFEREGYTVVEDTYKDAIPSAKLYDNDPTAPQSFRVIIEPKATPLPPAVVKQQAVVKYYDKSDNNNLLATSNTVEGDAGSPIQDTASTPDKGNTVEETIKYYTDRGYALVSNGFNPGKENATPVYDNVEGNVQEVPVVLEHTFEEVPPKTPEGEKPKTPGTPINSTPDSPNYPEKVDQRHLNKTVKRVIRYWIERENGEKAFDDVEQEVSFTRTAKVNKVTGAFVEYTPWRAADKTLDEVTSKPKDGYTVDRKVVSSVLVDPENVPVALDAAGHNYIENVIYRPVVTPPAVEQRARLVFKQVPSEEASSELDETDIPNVDPETVTGTEGGNIVFPTMAETIHNLEAKGYKVLKDGYANANPNDKDFNADPNDVQEFKIVVVPRTTPITPDQPGKPGEPIDPNNPGSKWPNDKGVDDVVRTVTRTVSYVKKDSVDATEETEAAPTRSNKVTFTRTGKINHVTGEVTWDAWTPAANDTTLDGSDLPEVPGYKAVKATNTVNNTLLAVTPQSTSEDVTGVNENSKDIVEKVIYVPVKQEAVVKYYDKSTNNTLLATSDKVEGTTGNPIQDTAATPEKGNNVEETIKYFTDRGYKVVSNGFNPGKDSEKPVYDNVEGNVQEVPVVLEHTFEEIPPTGKTPNEPIHPDPNTPEGKVPNTPNYPEGISEKDLNKTVTRVVRYWIGAVDGKKPEGATFVDVEQSVKFTRTAKVNKVTGEVVSYSEWMTNDNTLEEVVSPTLAGHTVDRTVVPSKAVAVTVENGTRYVEDVIYTPIAPKVGNVVVRYIDTEGNQVKEPRTDVPNSPVGTAYNTAETPEERPELIQNTDGTRYVRIPALTEGDEEGTVKEGTTQITYVYKKVANWVPLIPGQPKEENPRNPYPFDPKKPEAPIQTPPTTPDGTPNVPYVPGYVPNDPNGNPLVPVDPKDPNKGYIPPVPKAPGEDTYIPYVPVGTVEIEYRDTDGNPLRDPRLDTPLSKEGTPYNTGENPDERPDELTDKDGNRYVRVPSLTQGNEEGKVVKGKTTVIYVYKKVGNWIPLIPGEPNPPKNPYPFNPDKPNDPIPAVPEVPGKPGVPVVPYVPGYIPNDPDGNPLVPVDPNDPNKGYIPPVPRVPGEDTPIPYVPVTPEKPGNPSVPTLKPTPDPAPMPNPESTPAPQPEPLKELPKTGDAGSVAATAFGLGSILASLGLVGKRRRKKD